MRHPEARLDINLTGPLKETTVSKPRPAASPSRAPNALPSLPNSVRACIGLMLALLLVSPADADGQRSYAISGGATYGDFAGGLVNTDYRWGAIAGLSAAVRNWYTITQLEVNWVQKGGADVSLDYIEIPLLFGGLVQRRDGAGARLYTGVGVGFPVGCSEDGDTFCDLDRRTEWTWPIGLQMGRFAAGGRLVALDVRYSWAFTDAFDGGPGSNRSWQFKLVFGRQR